jgi:hypothetical protein
MEITLIYHDVPAWPEWDALLAAYPTPAHVTADAPLSADEREALAVYFALQAPPEAKSHLQTVYVHESLQPSPMPDTWQDPHARADALVQELDLKRHLRLYPTTVAAMEAFLSDKITHDQFVRIQDALLPTKSLAKSLADALTPDMPIQTTSTVEYPFFNGLSEKGHLIAMLITFSIWVVIAAFESGTL